MTRRCYRIPTTAICLLALLAGGVVACGPPPKPAGLIRLEAMRTQPSTLELQRRNPTGWSESDRYYRMAHEAWQDSDMEEAVDYSKLSTYLYRTAEARAKQLEAEETIKESSIRIEAASEQLKFYEKESRKMRDRVAELTTHLATAERQARAALIAASRQAKAASTVSEEEIAQVRQSIEQARAALAATEEVRANLYAAGHYNKAGNLLGRAERELELKTLDAARQTVQEVLQEVEAARTEATPKFQELERKRKLAELTDKLLAAARAVPDTEIRKEPRGVVVVVPDLFRRGRKAALKEERFITLDMVGKLMVDFPEVPIVIEGHTDASGPARARDRLAEDFARVVQDYYVQKGLDRARLKTAAYGDSMPIEDNKSRKGRARNRRVEIVFSLR